jgi:hypothetical protein
VNVVHVANGALLLAIALTSGSAHQPMTMLPTCSGLAYVRPAVALGDAYPALVARSALVDAFMPVGPAVSYCYEKALARGRVTSLSARFQLVLVVRPDGTVAKASLVSATIDDETAQCIARLVETRVAVARARPLRVFRVPMSFVPVVPPPCVGGGLA